MTGGFNMTKSEATLQSLLPMLILSGLVILFELIMMGIAEAFFPFHDCPDGMICN